MRVAAILSHHDCRKLVGSRASRMMIAADQGLVFPFQKRLGPHDYVYLAVRALGRLGNPFAQVAGAGARRPDGPNR